MQAGITDTLDSMQSFFFFFFYCTLQKNQCLSIRPWVTFDPQHLTSHTSAKLKSARRPCINNALY